MLSAESACHDPSLPARSSQDKLILRKHAWNPSTRTADLHGGFELCSFCWHDVVIDEAILFSEPVMVQCARELLKSWVFLTAVTGFWSDLLTMQVAGQYTRVNPAACLLPVCITSLCRPTGRLEDTSVGRFLFSRWKGCGPACLGLAAALQSQVVVPEGALWWAFWQGASSRR